jgi:serine/threonine-protein kinase
VALLHEHIEGKYEILEKLKEGGMGAIYKVRHRLLDEVRVVKVIRSHMEPTGETGERFLREARVAIRLRHPNIAALHDFAIADDGNAFIVMEFIDGLNLLEILHGNGPPPIALTLEVARQSLRALGYLHRQKIVHRDVSPDNLMLTRDVDGHVQVKLIDLGIAKAIEGGASGLTTTGIFLGKPRYAAPEQFGTMPLDARSDLYSFGVVLYELLTGRCPITGQDPASYMAGHLLRPPVSFAETDPQDRVPAELRKTVLRALAKKPEERFDSAEDFIWDLTLLQDRFSLTGRELDEVFAASIPALTQPVPLPGAGSTQDKLDREFLMTQTPVPTARASDPAEATLRLVDPPAARAPAEEHTRRSVPVDLDMTRRERSESLLDATWLTVPRTDPAPEEKSPSRSRWVRPVRTVLMAATAVLLVVAVWLGWKVVSQRKPAAPLEVQAPAPGTVPAGLPTQAVSTPVETQVQEVTPTPTPALQVQAPEPSPTPPKPRPREIAPEDAVVVGDATVVEPMKLGDLIRPGLRNVEYPETRQLATPGYPEAAKGSGKRATVTVRVLVDETGQVIEAKVRDGDGSGLGFNEAALEAARKTTFFPGTRDGIAGKMWSEVSFEFAE